VRRRYGQPPRAAKRLSGKGSAAAFAVRLPEGGASGVVAAGGRVLTVQQAAEVLQVKPRELVRFIRERGLRAVHLGRKLSWRIDERDLWAWLEAQKGAR